MWIASYLDAFKPGEAKKSRKQDPVQQYLNSEM